MSSITMTTTIHNDVITRSRDAVHQLVDFDDSLLQPSFSDLIDAWTMTSRESPYDDSRVSPYVNDDWSPGFPAGNSCDDVTWMTSHDIDDSGVFQQSVHYGDEWSLGNPAGSPLDDVRCHATPESRDVIRFTDEQVVCICRSLQQSGDIDKLESFLSTLPINQLSRESRRDSDVLPEAEVMAAVVSSAAHVAYHRGDYDRLYGLLSSGTFPRVYHEDLQRLWYEAHYREAALERGRSLSAVDKYRVRRKHPLPQTIWDGEQTVYCFKVGARQLLTEAFRTCRYPTSEERRSLAQQTGLTVTQVNNWFKNRRQRQRVSTTTLPPSSLPPSQASLPPAAAAASQQYLTSPHWAAMTSQLCPAVHPYSL